MKHPHSYFASSFVALALFAALPTVRAATEDNARVVIANRIVTNEYFQNAVRESFLDVAKSEVGITGEKAQTRAETDHLILIFNMSFATALANTFTEDELKIIEPIYTTSVGMSAVGKMRGLTDAWRVEFRRTWRIYSHQ